MDFEKELEKIDIGDELLNKYPALIDLCTDAKFIDSTLIVLDSDNISYKKNYFIDNQQNITDSMSNMKDILSLNISTLSDNTTAEDVIKLNLLEKLLTTCIKKLEYGINRFQKELNNDMTHQSNAIEISKEVILDAMQNNEGTKEITKNLKDIENQKEVISDEYTKKIQQDFNNLMQNKTRNRVSGNYYAIVENDMSAYEMVYVKNDNKSELNRLLENPNFRKPRLFKLVEVPTTSQVVQRTVTIVK